MARIVRIVVFTLVLFVIAVAIKVVFGSGDAAKTERLVQKMRMNGV